MINLISKYFNFQEKDTNLKTETVAGVTTFLTMAYALFLIPSVLGDAGMPEKSVLLQQHWQLQLGLLLWGYLQSFQWD